MTNQAIANLADPSSGWNFVGKGEGLQIYPPKQRTYHLGIMIYFGLNISNVSYLHTITYSVMIKLTWTKFWY